MTTQTDTLADFLLARIAERESVALDMRHQADAGRPKVVLHGGGTGYQELVDPARVLAECEAKRRIMEEFEQVQKDYRVAHTPTLEGQRFGLLKALAYLALPYADYPDYREEWRP